MFVGLFAPRLALLVACFHLLQSAVAFPELSDDAAIPRLPPRRLLNRDGVFLVTARKGGDAARAVHELQVEERLGGGGNEEADRVDAAAFGGRIAKAHLSPLQVKRLLSNPDIIAVEPDAQAYVSSVPWHLDRVDQQTLPLDGFFSSNGSSGESVRVYVLDTGVHGAHDEFLGIDGESRVQTGATFLSDSSQTTTPPADAEICDSHGTHCASLVAGITYGTATAATIVPVRVMECDGTGWLSDIVKGFEWAVMDAKRNLEADGTRAILSVSLGGSFDIALNEAAAEAVAENIPVVVAAGNEGTDACSKSPASEESVFTVGATTRYDTISYFSNHGACVDIFAPGSDVFGALHTGPSDSAALSGTSMATPIVAGIMALSLETHPGYTAREVYDEVSRHSAVGVLNMGGLSSETINALVNTPNGRDSGEYETTSPTTTEPTPALEDGAPTLRIGSSFYTFTDSTMADPAYHFGSAIPIWPPLRGSLAAVVDLGTSSEASFGVGCEELANANEVASRIALVRRGNCTFYSKALAAQRAGALAVVIDNNEGEPIPFRAPELTEQLVYIPVVMISSAAGGFLRQEMARNEIPPPFVSLGQMDPCTDYARYELDGRETCESAEPNFSKQGSCVHVPYEGDVLRRNRWRDEVTTDYHAVTEGACAEHSITRAGATLLLCEEVRSRAECAGAHAFLSASPELVAPWPWGTEGSAPNGCFMSSGALYHNRGDSEQFARCSETQECICACRYTIELKVPTEMGECIFESVLDEGVTETPSLSKTESPTMTRSAPPSSSTTSSPSALLTSRPSGDATPTPSEVPTPAPSSSAIELCDGDFLYFDEITGRCAIDYTALVESSNRMLMPLLALRAPNGTTCTLQVNTGSPTMSPTVPSRSPTVYVPPTFHPTPFLTLSPSKRPTVQPTRSPSKRPTVQPTRSPSKQPTALPTLSPSKLTVSPTSSPTSAAKTPCHKLPIRYVKQWARWRYEDRENGWVDKWQFYFCAEHDPIQDANIVSDRCKLVSNGRKSKRWPGASKFRSFYNMKCKALAPRTQSPTLQPTSPTEHVARGKDGMTYEERVSFCLTAGTAGRGHNCRKSTKYRRSCWWGRMKNEYVCGAKKNSAIP